MAGNSKSLYLLRKLPRVCINNVLPYDGKRKTRRSSRRIMVHEKSPIGHRRYPEIGFEDPTSFPYHLRHHIQSFNKDHHLKLSYASVSLHMLQLMIDTDRLRTDIPVDVTQFSLTGLFSIDPMENEGGILLDDEGMDCFCSTVNLEVQCATEPIIAAVEKHGGTITTAYYDPISLGAAIKPKEFFEEGLPIPRRMLPPQRLIEYYTSAKNRGYLANPEEVSEERFLLSQKYGYKLPDLTESPIFNMLTQRKDPRQIFFGLQPGWVVNLTDKHILKPADPELKKFYET